MPLFSITPFMAKTTTLIFRCFAQFVWLSIRSHHMLQSNLKKEGGQRVIGHGSAIHVPLGQVLLCAKTGYSVVLRPLPKNNYPNRLKRDTNFTNEFHEIDSRKFVSKTLSPAR